MSRLHLSGTRLDRFAECGSALWIGFVEGTGEIAMQSNRCRDRWCVPCGVDRAHRISDALMIAMDGMERCRFVTLTRRHNATPLKDQLDALWAAFNRLRDRRFWQACVTGGAAFVEVKVSEKTGAWHVHLHVIVTGGFIDQRGLSSEWLAVTQDSSIVDVRSVPNYEHLARYVTKYVTKPADASVFAVPDRLDEMIVALAGRRLCGTFGVWRGVKLNGDEEPPRKLQRQRSWHGIVGDAKRGDPDALTIWSMAVERWPSLRVFGVPSG